MAAWFNSEWPWYVAGPLITLCPRTVDCWEQGIRDFIEHEPSLFCHCSRQN